MFRLYASALAGFLAMASGLAAAAPPPGLDKINHIVVLYLENRSFDNLFGLFPGADGVADAGRAATQVDLGGVPFKTLPPVLKDGKPDPEYPANLPNAPFRADKFVPLDQKHGDLVHRFYQEQQQIDGGWMDKFAAVSNAGGLTMSYYDGSSLELWQYAKRYTLADHFFHAAFGGSFLNHFWLICACTPKWDDAAPELRAELDASGNLVKDGQVTPDGFAVNTTELVYQPHSEGADPKKLLPPQTMPTIGDRLDEKGIGWAWYAGGYQAVMTGHADPKALFMTHHQPFVYFKSYADGTAAKGAHLKDEADFLDAIDKGTLPAVSFWKPDGRDDEHPGYATVAEGDRHAALILRKIEASPNWKDTVVIVTSDENGGLWDHVAPPKKDRWGPGSRVATIIVSPFAKQGYIDHTSYDTTSILALIEARFELKPLTDRDAKADPMLNAFDFGAKGWPLKGSITALFWVIEILVMLLLFYPLWHFFDEGWGERCQEFSNSIGQKDLGIYLKRFWPASERESWIDADEAARATFFQNKIYVTLIGKRRYIGPGLLLFAIAFVSTALAVIMAMRSGYEHYFVFYHDWQTQEATTLVAAHMPLTELDGTFWPFPIVTLSLETMAAIAGAYLFVVSVIIQGTRARTLVTADLLWASARFVIAIPMGLSLAQIANASLGAFVAFGLGAFPMDSLLKLIRRITGITLNKSEQEDASDQLVKLMGVTPDISACLGGEGISAVQQLADVDPVALAIRSGLAFDYVIFLVCQAQAWCFIGDVMQKLAPLGLGDARAILELSRRLDVDPNARTVLEAAAIVAYGSAKSSSDAAPKPSGGAAKTGDAASAAAPAASADADARKQWTAMLENAFRDIANDEYTEFLAQFAVRSGGAGVPAAPLGALEAERVQLAIDRDVAALVQLRAAATPDNQVVRQAHLDHATALQGEARALFDAILVQENAREAHGGGPPTPEETANLAQLRQQADAVAQLRREIETAEG